MDIKNSQDGHGNSGKETGLIFVDDLLVWFLQAYVCFVEAKRSGGQLGITFV
ncbi:hypothetical protein Syun_020131 [Stephania yunnanensis]|uniref:Uncharacterized protein n=1 Tax=Stephania yunnanensis TaxID=152371 RepID=A0AAP0NPD1_9MAGN